MSKLTRIKRKQATRQDRNLKKYIIHRSENAAVQ